MTSTAHSKDSAPAPLGALVPLFLDFEGVLRPADAGGALVCARNFLPPLLAAEAMGLRPVMIVASTYRLDYGVSDLAAILESHAPGFGRFVQGATPVASRMSLSQEEAETCSKAVRLFEVRSWLSRARLRMPIADWIAIDDTASLYGATPTERPPEFLKCDPRVGFDEERAAELLSRFRAIAAKHGWAAPATPAPHPAP